MMLPFLLSRATFGLTHRRCVLTHLNPGEDHGGATLDLEWYQHNAGECDAPVIVCVICALMVVYSIACSSYVAVVQTFKCCDEPPLIKLAHSPSNTRDTNELSFS
jgi:hypothetical protein